MQGQRGPKLRGVRHLVYEGLGGSRWEHEMPPRPITPRRLKVKESPLGTRGRGADQLETRGGGQKCLRKQAHVHSVHSVHSGDEALGSSRPGPLRGKPQAPARVPGETVPQAQAVAGARGREWGTRRLRVGRGLSKREAAPRSQDWGEEEAAAGAGAGSARALGGAGSRAQGRQALAAKEGGTGQT